MREYGERDLTRRNSVAYFFCELFPVACIMRTSRPQMKLIKNTGNDRVMDALRAGLTPAAKLDIATPALSVFAFAEFAAQLQSLSACRLVLPDNSQTDLQLLG